MQQLLQLYQFATYSEQRDGGQPLAFVRDKFSQEHWLRASMLPFPGCDKQYCA